MRRRRARDPLQCLTAEVLPTRLAPTDPEGWGKGWLLSDGRVLASLEIPVSRRDRFWGLLGRDGIGGAMLFCPARSVHSFGMRFELDVAYIDADGFVVRTLRLPRHRLAPPVWRARCVLEAEVGAFGQWGLGIGDQVEVRR